MTSAVTRVLAGVIAGAWGTLGMAGISFFVRRMVEPTRAIPTMHYERVVERAISALGRDELDSETRVRAGELAHIGFGAAWGIVFALLTQGRAVRPLSQGLAAGTAMWGAAFGGYMPALGISKSFAAMDNYERFRTWISHAVFAVTAFTVLKAFPRSSS